MKDALGRVIKPGDALAYASRRGSDHRVVVAVVDQVVDVQAGWSSPRQFARAHIVASTGVRYDEAASAFLPARPGKRVSLQRTENMLVLDGFDGGVLHQAAEDRRDAMQRELGDRRRARGLE